MESFEYTTEVCSTPAIGAELQKPILAMTTNSLNLKANDGWEPLIVTALGLDRDGKDRGTLVVYRRKRK